MENPDTTVAVEIARTTDHAANGAAEQTMPHMSVVLKRGKTLIDTETAPPHVDDLASVDDPESVADLASVDDQETATTVDQHEQADMPLNRLTTLVAQRSNIYQPSRLPVPRPTTCINTGGCTLNIMG